MAEERLIDDDKDKKYRIRINENGDEELVIIDDPEEEESDAPLFSVVTDEEQTSSDDDTAQRLEERRQAAQRKADELKAVAIVKMQEGDWESAQYALSQASELTEYDGELYFLQLKAYSRGMTNFLELEKCVDASVGVREYTGEEQKDELKALSQPLQARIAEFEKKCEEISAQNEQGKEERRQTFLNAKKKSLIVLACTLVPFIALTVLAIVFATMMFDDLSGIYMILTIVFAAVAVVAFAVNIFTFHKFWNSQRMVKLNEMDTSTKLGRELISCREELENLKGIYSSFQNDIS